MILIWFLFTTFFICSQASVKYRNTNFIVSNDNGFSEDKFIAEQIETAISEYLRRNGFHDFFDIMLKPVHKSCMVYEYKKHNLQDRIPTNTGETEKFADIVIFVDIVTLCAYNNKQILQSTFDFLTSFRSIQKVFELFGLKHSEENVKCIVDYASQNDILSPEKVSFNYDSNYGNASEDVCADFLKDSKEKYVKLFDGISDKCEKVWMDIDKFYIKTLLLNLADVKGDQRLIEQNWFVKEGRVVLKNLLFCFEK